MAESSEQYNHYTNLLTAVSCTLVTCAVSPQHHAGDNGPNVVGVMQKTLLYSSDPFLFLFFLNSSSFSFFPTLSFLSPSFLMFHLRLFCFFFLYLFLPLFYLYSLSYSFIFHSFSSISFLLPLFAFFLLSFFSLSSTSFHYPATLFHFLFCLCSPLILSHLLPLHLYLFLCLSLFVLRYFRILVFLSYSFFHMRVKVDVIGS